VSALDILRHQAGVTRAVVAMNLDGVSEEQALVCPRPAGNSLNWVLGHLLSVYNDVLPLLGREPVWPRERLTPYLRGSAPLATGDALPLAELRSGWDEATTAVEAGLAELDPARLPQPAPFSPSNDPNETVGTLLSTVLFHPSYHAGQLGVLRRVAGLAGAVT
jgi:uncharacterized damage-inducible protein DinB